jgi:hypothetical protein
MRRKLLIAGSALTAVAWLLLSRRSKRTSDPKHEVTLTVVRDKVWIMCSCGWDGDDAGSIEEAIVAGRRHDLAAAIRLDRGAGLETIDPGSPPLNPVGALTI